MPQREIILPAEALQQRDERGQRHEAEWAVGVGIWNLIARDTQRVGDQWRRRRKARSRPKEDVQVRGGTWPNPRKRPEQKISRHTDHRAGARKEAPRRACPARPTPSIRHHPPHLSWSFLTGHPMADLHVIQRRVMPMGTARHRTLSASPLYSRKWPVEFSSICLIRISFCCLGVLRSSDHTASVRQSGFPTGSRSRAKSAHQERPPRAPTKSAHQETVSQPADGLARPLGPPNQLALVVRPQ